MNRVILHILSSAALILLIAGAMIYYWSDMNKPQIGVVIPNSGPSTLQWILFGLFLAGGIINLIVALYNFRKQRNNSE